MASDNTIPSEKLKLYDQLVSQFPDIERKGATMPYTSLNGHMFSFLDKDGHLNLRLSKEHLAAFLKKYNTGLSVQHGVVMKEYAVVPDGLLNNTEELRPYFQASCDYTRTLKPKPTKGKK